MENIKNIKEASQMQDDDVATKDDMAHDMATYLTTLDAFHSWSR